MSENCQLVVFSNKAYNAIIRESFDKDPVETGGILLGHILDNGVWIVMEVLPPGINSIFEYAYFEYDEAFVNYLAQSVANQYKRPLDLLGLWHRHPGSMDYFSTTDDGTNATFARQNSVGVISGLVNIDPQFRLTMYHMDRPAGRLMGRPYYETVDVEVGDDIIPEEYFELRYYDGENSNLHPMVAERQRNTRPRPVENPNGRQIQPPYHNPEGEQGELDINRIMSNQLPPCDEPHRATPKSVDDFFSFWRASNKKWMYILLAIAVLIIGPFTIKSCKDNIEGIISNWVSKIFEKTPSLSTESINLETVGESYVIEVENTTKSIDWESSNKQVATVDKEGKVTAVAKGSAIITAFIDKEKVEGECKVTVGISTSETESESKTGGHTDSNILNKPNATIDISRTYHRSKGDSMKIGDPPVAIPLLISVSGEPTPTVKFKSINPWVATVDTMGRISANNVGSTGIEITCNEMPTDTFTITVTAK